MRAVDRRFFLSDANRPLAAIDAPIAIGFDQTTSQPSLIGHMISLLSLGKDDAVLEIGTGSGYPSAILARLAGEVYTLEIVPELFSSAMDRLGKLKISNLWGKNQSGHVPWGDGKTFSKIVVWAACEELPTVLLDQLRQGGTMVLPIGPHGESQRLAVVKKNADGTWQRSDSIGVRFVPFRR